MTTRQKFKALLRAGMLYVDIASALGVTKRCLYKWRIELGLAERIRGRKRMR
jgi:transposase-like protein